MRQEKRSLQRASVAELVDATDSKSVSGDRVGVRFPSAAPSLKKSDRQRYAWYWDR